ncbi:DMT family transporter [Streptomyces sp. ISL-22]|uniref:DMT family transporter n=1 Tax=unclassified Streptomyces TaxID=2593676 RepID=UPI001BE725B1|nr:MULTISPECIES: DMT family transporter [unclassified Streptomyces]MBT2422706.1 DMT family transporter [Streptomyces sp. ISL-24]MBT2435931.1 DMT family transporter [Streptomyces sp. ISL-22]
MSDVRRTDAVLLLVALVWGSSYLSAQTATAALPVLLVLFARYALSALACLGVVAAGRHGPRRWTRDELRAGLLLGVTQAAVLVVETYGVAHTSAANAGLIISLTIVLTPLLDRGGHRGALPVSFFAATGVCVLAIGLLMSGNGFQAPRLGDLLMLGAALIRAAHVALVGRLTTGRAIRPLHLTTVQTLVGTALFLPMAALDLPTLVHADPATWAQLVYLALFCSVFAFLAQTWAVQRTSASRASLLLGTEPVWAVAIGVALGGEHLTPLTGLGAVLMVAGTYWGQTVERTHRTAPRPPLPSPHPLDKDSACPTASSTTLTTT